MKDVQNVKVESCRDTEKAKRQGIFAINVNTNTYRRKRMKDETLLRALEDNTVALREMAVSFDKLRSDLLDLKEVKEVKKVRKDLLQQTIEKLRRRKDEFNKSRKTIL